MAQATQFSCGKWHKAVTPSIEILEDRTNRSIHSAIWIQPFEVTFWHLQEEICHYFNWLDDVTVSNVFHLSISCWSKVVWTFLCINLHTTKKINRTQRHGQYQFQSTCRYLFLCIMEVNSTVPTQQKMTEWVAITTQRISLIVLKQNLLQWQSIGS